MKEIFQDFKEFFLENPKEFVVIQVISEYGRKLNNAQKKYIFEHIIEVLGDKMITNHDKRYWFTINNSTLKDVIEQKRNCYIVYDADMHGFEIGEEKWDSVKVEELGFNSINYSLRNKWHKATTIQQIKEKNLEEVQSKWGTDPSEEKYYLNSQLIMTPDVGGCCDVLKIMFGLTTVRPDKFALSLYKPEELDTFIRDNTQYNWNFMSFDFVTLIPSLMAFIISLNFKTKLTIIKAVAQGCGKGPVDVTEALRSKIARECVVFLTQPQKDMGIDFSSGKLTVAYQFEGEEVKVHTTTFSDYEEYLLGKYSQNKGSLVNIDREQAEKKGVVCEDKILTAEEGKNLLVGRTEEAPVMHYTIQEDGQVKFELAKKL